LTLLFLLDNAAELIMYREPRYRFAEDDYSDCGSRLSAPTFVQITLFLIWRQPAIT